MVGFNKYIPQDHKRTMKEIVDFIPANQRAFLIIMIEHIARKCREEGKETALNDIKIYLSGK
jgi:hypothetical protein